MKYQFILGLFLLGACSSTKVETTKEVDPMSTSDGLCQKWAEGACNDTVVSDCATSQSACIATQKSFCMTLVAQRYPGRSFVVAKSNACADAVKAAYSDSRLTAAEYDTVINFGPPCDTLDTEATDAAAPVGCDAAVCQPGGFPCSPPDQGCISGFYCNNSVCTVLPVSGQTCCVGSASCVPVLPCGAQYYCNGNEGSQTCQPKPGLGLACSLSIPCQEGLLCSDPTNGVCTQQLALVPTGPLCANLR